MEEGMKLGRLIRLEYRKNRVIRYIRNALLLTAALLALLFAMTYLGIARDPDMGVVDTAFDGMGTTANVELLANISFLIFAAVMHGNFTIREYRTGTILQMFTYPLGRGTILLAKAAAVWLFLFAAETLSKLALYGALYLGSLWRTPDFPLDYRMTDAAFYGGLALGSAVTASVSLIALYVGVWMKSSKAAIIVSLLLIVLMQGNIGGASLFDNPALPALLLGASALAGVLLIRLAVREEV